MFDFKPDHPDLTPTSHEFLFNRASLLGPDFTIDQPTNGAEPSEPAQIRSGRPCRSHSSIAYTINVFHYFSAAATVPS
jgi:hypothetical protein